MRTPMSKATFTPGPWEFDGEYIWADAIRGYVANPCTEDMSARHSDEIAANARLIAAAPELLAAANAIIAAHNALFVGFPLMQEGKPVNHRLLNEAARLAGIAVRKAGAPSAGAMERLRPHPRRLSLPRLHAPRGDVGPSSDGSVKMTTPKELREIAEYACFDSMTDSYRSPAEKHPAWAAADRIEALEAALWECREYFDNRADAEYFTDSPYPVANDEMRRLVEIDEVLK